VQVDSVKMSAAVAPVVLVHGGAGSIPESMNQDKFKGISREKGLVTRVTLTVTDQHT
jgi:hypothetical protein